MNLNYFFLSLFLNNVTSPFKSVILWNGSTGGKVGQLTTAHRGNVFSVNFLPDTRDRFIVTGTIESISWGGG